MVGWMRRNWWYGVLLVGVWAMLKADDGALSPARVVLWAVSAACFTAMMLVRGIPVALRSRREGTRFLRAPKRAWMLPILVALLVVVSAPLGILAAVLFAVAVEAAAFGILVAIRYAPRAGQPARRLG